MPADQTDQKETAYHDVHNQAGDEPAGDGPDEPVGRSVPRIAAAEFSRSLPTIGDPRYDGDPSRNEPDTEGLEQFPARLPHLWQSGEPRATHRRTNREPRYWRTRKDPFDAVWREVLVWLQKEPEATAKCLFQRLQQQYPEQFPNGQLRTLQRRMRQWRQVMARELVFSDCGSSSSTATQVPELVSQRSSNSEAVHARP